MFVVAEDLSEQSPPIGPNGTNAVARGTRLIWLLEWPPHSTIQDGQADYGAAVPPGLALPTSRAGDSLLETSDPATAFRGPHSHGLFTDKLGSPDGL